MKTNCGHEEINGENIESGLCSDCLKKHNAGVRADSYALWLETEERLRREGKLDTAHENMRRCRVQI